MEEIAVLVMLTIFSVVGTIGNSLVLYIYATKKEKSTAGIFIMSLAGTDLCTCLVIVPYTEAAIALDYKLRYDAVCKIYMFLITCNIPFSAFVMVAIAIDRYFCICRPFLHAINLQRAKAIVICLLVLASVLGAITSLSHGVYILQPTSAMPQGQNGNRSDSDTINNKVNHTESGILLDVTNYTSEINSYDVKQHNLALKNSLFYNNVYNSTFSDDLFTNITRTDLRSNVTTGTTSEQSYTLVYIGVCVPNNIILDADFSNTYQKVYAGCYLVSFCAVLILYGLIYKSIHQHRAKKSKRKRSSLYPAGVEYSVAETQITAVTHVNPHGNGTGNQSEETVPMQQRQRKFHKPMSIKEKTLLANIRTAAMLFVVTIVFLVAFLPAWLMAIQAVTFNTFIFYMYFVYNTANPFIYAFMNKSFRDDLGKVMKCQSVPMVR